MSNELFPWKNEYSVGHPLLDADHKELFSIINELHQQIESNETSSRDVLLTLVDRLTHYVQEHFEREEYFMAEGDYPHLKDHRRKHHDFMRVVYAIHKITDDRPDDIDLIKLRDFLGSWLKRHILQADHDYIPYLHNVLGRRKSDGFKSLGATYAQSDKEEFISVTVQVPFYAANILRRCARMLRLGGDNAKVVESACDPIAALNITDALEIAKIVTTVKDESAPDAS